MEREWSLKELYPNFKCEAYEKDIKDFEEEIKKLQEWCAANLVAGSGNESEKIENYINFQNYFERFTKPYDYASLILSTDSLNQEAAKALDQLEEMAAELKTPEIMFIRFLKGIENLDEIISGSETLCRHEFFLKELQSRRVLEQREEEIIARLKITGSGLWTKMHEQLTSTLLAEVDIQGEVKRLPISVVRSMAYHKDGEIRKAAYQGELEACEKISKSVAFALNGIKGEVVTTTKLRGYESVLDMTLQDSRMEREALDAMFEAVKEFLPAFRKYFRRKAELLGHKNGLPFYDLFAPLGEVNMRFSYDEAAEFIVKNFTDFSPSLGEFAKRAFENRWIDVEPREGKRGGAFCSGVRSIKESRIMVNFEGSFNDVLTLAHELGHGYHGEQLKNETYLNSNYPMPIAETASTLCETIICNSALKDATEEQSRIILENSISGAAQVVVDIYSRFMFEDEVIRRRSEGSLSVDELKEIMIKAQKEAYGDGLDWSMLHPYMWLVKPHYYYAEENYYNFPYAYGQLFSKGLYAKYKETPEKFLKDYDNMLAATGKNKLSDVAKLAEVDVTEKNFWRRSLEMIEKEIEEF